MSTEEIRSEIDRELNKFSAESLQAILEVLRRSETNRPISIFDISLIEKILSEDKELLHRLAQ